MASLSLRQAVEVCYSYSKKKKKDHLTCSMKESSDSLLFRHSTGRREVGGYLQQDNSNVISKQLLCR